MKNTNLWKKLCLYILITLTIGYPTTSIATNSETCWCNTSGDWAGSEATCCASTGTKCVFGTENFSGCSGETNNGHYNGYYCPNNKKYAKCL